MNRYTIPQLDPDYQDREITAAESFLDNLENELKIYGEYEQGGKTYISTEDWKQIREEEGSDDIALQVAFNIITAELKRDSEGR